jgi:15-cis-phytoene synthase
VTTKQAYRRCREITRREARNFYFGFVMLSRARRNAIYAAYAFSRRADDSVDGEDSHGAKLAAVKARRSEINSVYAGTMPTNDPVLVALEDAVVRFQIPRKYFDDLLDGVEMDLTQHRYGNWPALESYCARVAGAVGVISLYIFGFSNPVAPRHANDLGIAMQIVNIMRDVAEDAARDRIYITRVDMGVHGIGEHDIKAGATSPAFRELMDEYSDRAREYLARGEMLLPLIDRRSRMCVATLAGLYVAILKEIEELDYNVFHGRVSLSAGQKLGVMARAMITGRVPQ